MGSRGGILRPGMADEGVWHDTSGGVPLGYGSCIHPVEGGPLSLLLSITVLYLEREKRKHTFARYADDLMI